MRRRGADGLPGCGRYRRVMRPLLRRLLVPAILLVVLAGCGGSTNGDSSDVEDAETTPAAAVTSGAGEQRYPDIVDVELTPADDSTYDLAVTVSSPYDTPQRYADGWRVLAPDGAELGAHTLAHDHAGEQRFTRTQTGVEIPESVDEVTVEGRDEQYGYGGDTVTVAVPREGG